ETHLKILKISSISESPGNRGLRDAISAKMQPTDHISTPVEYWRPPSRISGERYHSVTTSRLSAGNMRLRAHLLRGCRCAEEHQMHEQGQSRPASCCLPN